MMRSMLADQPYSPVTSTQGESARRVDTMTLSTLSSSTSFISLHRPSVAALASSSSFFSSSVSSIFRPSFVAETSFFSLVLLELLDAVLVHGVDHEDDLVALLLELLEEGRRLDGALGFAGDVVDARLVVGHARDVVVERRLLLAGFGGVVAEQLGDLRPVGRVLVHAELEVFGERLVEFLVLVLVLGHLVEELDRFLDQVLLDDFEDLVLLQRLARDVERQVLRVDDALDKGQELRHQVLAVVHDEHAAHVKLDVVELLFVAALEHVEGRAARHKEHRAELELALDGEVLHGGVVLPVVGERLVERRVLLLRHLVRLAHPDGLLAVEVVPLVGDLLDLLLVDVLDFRGVVVVRLLVIVVPM